MTELVDGLAAKLESPKPKDAPARELGVLGLKTMVGECAPGARATAQLVSRLAPRLCEGVCKGAAGAEGHSPGARVGYESMLSHALRCAQSSMLHCES